MLNNKFLRTEILAMENMCDFIVAKKKTTANRLGKIGLILLAFSICFAVMSFQYLIYAVPIVVVFVGVGVWYLWRFFNVEYEYSMVGSELKVDIIYGQRQRRNMLMTASNRFESFGPYNRASAARLQSPDINERYVACTSLEDSGIYYAVFPGKKGRAVLLFQPSEKMLRLIKRYAQRSIFHDMDI